MVICLRRSGGRRVSMRPSTAKLSRERAGGAGGARRGRRAKCDDRRALTGAASARIAV